MHEVAIMENTLEIALEQASKQGTKRIHSFNISVGELSGIIPEALEFAFDVVVKGTIAEGAKLIIDKIPVICYCPDCDLEFHPLGWFYQCPQCLKNETQIRQGKELQLTELEVS